jgi:hypothetical protein
MFSALIAVAAAFLFLAVSLAQPLEDVREEFVPLVNIGTGAILLAVGIGTFRGVYRGMREPGEQSAR